QAETGQETARLVDEDPRTGNTADLKMSNDGRTIALLIDAGNRHFVRFVDARTMKRTRAAELPLGDGSLGDFSADDQQLLVRWSTPTRPGDVFSVAVATGKATPLRDEPRTGLEARPE